MAVLTIWIYLFMIFYFNLHKNNKSNKLGEYSDKQIIQMEQAKSLPMAMLLPMVSYFKQQAIICKAQSP